MIKKRIVIIVSMLIGALIGNAQFQALQLKAVPIARLIKNLEAKIKIKPKDPDLLFGLARIYSMAYARKTSTLEVNMAVSNIPEDKQDVETKDIPWLGDVPKGIPYQVESSDNKNELALAGTYLNKAIELHKKVIELKPNHYLARLGLAWCNEQAGDKTKAIELYRALIRESLPEDRKIKYGYDRSDTISTEASKYLVKLLDPKADAKEIANLKKQSEETEKAIKRKITPIAFALESNLKPQEFVDPRAKVQFDLDGSGKRNWQWIAKNTAWLVYYSKGEDNITSGLQMFGNVTFWLFWENGYKAMASLDDDGNGKLQGREIQNLGLWHDQNQNGISEAGEVKSLTEYGILELDCTYIMSQSGMPYNPKGVVYKDGYTRPSCDVILKSKD